MSTIQQFDLSVNVLKAILWQFDNAENLISLIQDKQNWLDTNYTEFWNDWYVNVFNLQTADDFGLSVWAYILNFPLFIGVSSGIKKGPVFGLAVDDTGSNGNQNLNNGNLALDPGGIILTTEQKRLLLKLRYFQLVTRDAIPEINSFLAFAFQDLGQIFAMDGLNMTIIYVINFSIDPVLLYVLQQYDILPRPTAVGIRYITYTTGIFGLALDDTGSNGNQNLNNGNFLPGT